MKKVVRQNKGQNSLGADLGGGLNQLIIHDDVPFFWDNWDIMHHAYETKVKRV